MLITSEKRRRGAADACSRVQARAIHTVTWVHARIYYPQERARHPLTTQQVRAGHDGRTQTIQVQEGRKARHHGRDHPYTHAPTELFPIAGRCKP